MIDLRPAAQRTAVIISAVTDDQLGAPTPCGELSVGGVIDHLGMFAVRFVAVAHKESGDMPAPPRPSAENLEPGWRARISNDLAALGQAWQEPGAWDGTTYAGGLELPGTVAGLVAIDELVVHTWDVAVATGQPFEPAQEDVDAALQFVTSFEAPRDGSLFGAIAPIPDDSSAFHHLLALTGRNPTWPNA